ncbi:MAG: hypothetical protein V3T05_07165, partial [Myxococcota bacterium]
VELEDALRVILTPIGYSFEITGKELIVFSRYVRVFRINVPMIQQEWSSHVTNDQAIGGEVAKEGGQVTGRDSAALGARVSLKTKSGSKGLWEELEDTFQTLLSKDGTFSINRTAGLITVNDKPYALDAVERYIEAINEEMSRQALIEIRLAEVSISDRTRAGIDWNVLWDRIGGMALGAKSFAASALIRDLRDEGAVAFSLAGVPGSAILTALAEQGEVTLVSQPNLIVGNNMPALIQSGKIRTYVSSVTQLVVPNVGVQVTLNTQLLSSGLIMSVLPRLNNNGTVTLAISVVLQEIVSLETREFRDVAAVELPTFNRRSYTGVVTGRYGETLIIAGLITKRESDVQRGVPFLAKIPVLGALFGSIDSESVRSELVILMTPKEVIAAPAGSTQRFTGLRQ